MTINTIAAIADRYQNKPKLLHAAHRVLLSFTNEELKSTYNSLKNENKYQHGAAHRIRETIDIKGKKYLIETEVDFLPEKDNKLLYTADVSFKTEQIDFESTPSFSDYPYSGDHGVKYKINKDIRMIYEKTEKMYSFLDKIDIFNILYYDMSDMSDLKKEDKDRLYNIYFDMKYYLEKIKNAAAKILNIKDLKAKDAGPVYDEIIKLRNKTYEDLIKKEIKKIRRNSAHRTLLSALDSILDEYSKYADEILNEYRSFDFYDMINEPDYAFKIFRIVFASAIKLIKERLMGVPGSALKQIKYDPVSEFEGDNRRGAIYEKLILRYLKSVVKVPFTVRNGEFHFNKPLTYDDLKI